MKYQVIITPEIQYLFKELSNQLSISIEFDTITQILEDCEDDQVNSKEYWISSQLDTSSVKGIVDDYEPETLIIETKDFKSKEDRIIDKIIESYNFSFGSGSAYRANSENLKLFKKTME
ncbi:MAG: hypothetical protein WA960_04305 [Tunicatimonas sp.]